MGWEYFYIFFIYTFFLSKIKINKKSYNILYLTNSVLNSSIILITTKSNDQMIEEMCKAINNLLVQ